MRTRSISSFFFYIYSYSPELLKAYWDDQAETRDEFIERTAKKLKTKRGALKMKGQGKSSKPISVETDDSDDEVGTAVDTEPPEGFAWRNALSIENMYGDESDGLYAEVNWYVYHSHYSFTLIDILSLLSGQRARSQSVPPRCCGCITRNW